jgi:hypothetical protein
MAQRARHGPCAYGAGHTDLCTTRATPLHLGRPFPLVVKVVEKRERHRMSNFTAKEKHDEVIREVEMRKSMFPRWVTMGKLTQREADRRIAIMREIADDYRKLANREQLL